MNLMSSIAVTLLGSRNGDREGSPLPLQGQDRVLGGDVGGDQLEDLGIHLKARQVDCRHAVLAGQLLLTSVSSIKPSLTRV